jgi:hypothetical protein
MVALTLAMSRVDTETRIIGGTAAQQEMARWAVGRFTAVELDLPSLEVRFHKDRTGCGGRSGLYGNGTADLCGVHVNWMSQGDLLHEMAHAWVEANISADLKARFLRLRQLETWNDHDMEWEARGTEHAAEIISWALDGQPTGMQQASIPRNDPDELAAAYQLLTGHPLPELAGRRAPSPA